MHKNVQAVLESVAQGKALSRNEVQALLPLFAAGSHDTARSVAHDDNVDDALLDVFALARIALSAYPVARDSGQSAAKPFTCGIINARSGRCPDDCSFCAQSHKYATDVSVYPLVSADKLMARADVLAEHGVDYMGIVISGTKPSPRNFEQICQTAQVIIQQTGIKLCASLGLLTLEQGKMLKDAGFTSYHHNLETAVSYYPQVCTTHGIERRIETIKNAKAAGLRVCAGGIFGLGEQWTQRLEMAETLQQLNVDSIPINFLNPIPGTPLGTRKTLPPQEALAVVALFRLMHPGKDIVICGGRTATLGDWENLLFSAGANGLMVGDYLTTRGSPFEKDLRMLQILGLRN